MLQKLITIALLICLLFFNPKKNRIWLNQLRALLFLFCVWHLASICLATNILPTPFKVAETFFKNLKNGTMLIHTAYSLKRLFGGISLAICIGAPIGILLGYFKKIDQFWSPLVYILGPLPKIAFLPLIMLFFGLGDPSKIFIVFIVMLFMVIITLRDAVKKIPEELYYPFITAKSHPFFILVHIVLPSAVPEIFTAVRLGLATGISVLFIAETYGTTWGLGFYIMDMWMRVNYTAMYAGIVTMGLVGLVCVGLVDFLHKKLCPWAKIKDF